MTFTIRKQRKVKCVVTPSQPQAVDVVHVTSLLRIAIVVIVITFVFMELFVVESFDNLVVFMSNIVTPEFDGTVR